MWTRSPRRGVRKTVKMDTESWTRSPKSSKDGHGVRKAVKIDTESWIRSPKNRNAEATTSVRVRCGAPEREDSDSSDLSSDYVYDGTMGETTFQDLHAHTGDAVTCECCRSEAMLWVRLTLGTKAHLVSVGSEDRTWLSHKDGHHFSLVMWMMVCAECAWLMLPPNVLICRRRTLLPGQSCFVGALSLGRSGLAAEAITCWECPGLATGTFACEAVARCSAWGSCSFAGLGGCSFAGDQRLTMRDSSSGSAYVPSWTGDQSLS
ncbi:hypothetical protein CRG98_029568 [Punica granatum]|uniref:Uncharacterized protein n=1 Tax=Punica granatum TaxID=22663 RepID=A0A2I0J1E7_PUNGR|nr:hypothetical protein CRG98_029568 [Punica granatum]